MSTTVMITLVEWKTKEAKITSNNKSEFINLEDQSTTRVILLAYNDKDAILKEAENLRFRKFKKPTNQKIYDKEKRKKLEYLDPKIIKYEEKEFLNTHEIEKYEGGTFESILTESEINLCAYSLLNSMKLKSSFPHLSEKLPLGIYPPLEEETAIFYLLKYEYVLEVVPLHSRSRSKENHK